MTRRRRTRGAVRSALPLAWLAVVFGTSACHWGLNYTAPGEPRYAAPLPAPPPDARRPDTLLVVSFNIREGVEVERALEVLTSEVALSDPDLVLLQEMDADGTARIARALGMGYVYYPAVLRKSTGRDFGNAVLSRWPIVADAKIVLPYRSVFGRTQRTATAATVRVGGTSVRVYSVHLATAVNQALQERADQLRAVLDDAAGYPRVVLGGDLNDARLAGLATERGFGWPTRDGPRTALYGRLDHVLFKGLEERGAGTVLDNRDSSDHRPVWARGILR